jgi:phospholipid transport system substrate-binding protein
MAKQMPPTLNSRVAHSAVRWIKDLKGGDQGFAARGVAVRLGWRLRLSLVGLVFCGQVAVASFSFAAPSELTDPIEQLNAGLLKVMKAGKTLTFQQRYDLLAPAISRAVNLKFIMKSAAGDRWDSLPAAQQQALVETFQRYAVAMCASHFEDYAGERFELLPAAKTEKGDPVVKVKIVPGNPRDDVHVLSYTMQKNGAEWQAVDVVIDGFVSFAAVKEAELRAILWSKGAPELLVRLQQLAEALSENAAAARSTK